MSYTPNPGYSGPDSFTFTVYNGAYTSSPGTVSITVTPVDIPNATGQVLTVTENAANPSVLGFTFTGWDADGLPLTYTITNNPAHGVLTHPDPTTPTLYYYTPNTGYTGPDSITFTANNGYFTSAPAFIAITVLPVYQNPLASSQTVSTPHGTPVSITLQGYDPNGETLTYNIVNPPTQGTLDTSNFPIVVYTPTSPAFSGTDLVHLHRDGPEPAHLCRRDGHHRCDGDEFAKREPDGHSREHGLDRYPHHPRRHPDGSDEFVIRLLDV